MDPKPLNRHTSTALVAEMRKRNSLLNEADAKLAVARVFDSLEALVSGGEDVRVANFGTFRRKHNAGRTIKPIGGGEPIQTTGRNVIAFKAANPAKK